MSNEREPRTVSRDDWLTARARLLAKEKALTRAADALAAERRRLPRERIGNHYRFVTTDGPATLLDLFDGRRQLIVYHHMLVADDPAPCSGCGMVGDQMPHLAHLHARDTSLVFVSRAPIEQIAAFRERMGWQVPWVASHDDFSRDVGITDSFGINVFLRENGDVLRTWNTDGRGVEHLGTPWTLLDITPFGRQESWEVAPPGTPQGAVYAWWRLHDEYDR